MSTPSDGIKDDIRTTIIADTGIPAGTLLANRFFIHEELGQGGQAHVYRAHDEITDKTIAIKVLARRTELSESAIQRLRDELLAARRISDPNIIRVHEFYRDEAYVFYTMDYIAGQTLAQRLQENVSMPDAERWFHQIIAGVQACHREQVIHGDLKPANLLIDTSNNLVIADFGISAVHGDSYTRGSGTDGYRAPEIDEGEAISNAVDIYALGKVIQRILNAVPRHGTRTHLWRLRWLKLAKRMLNENPENRSSLTKIVRKTTVTGSRRHIAMAALVVLLLFLATIYQHYSNGTGPELLVEPNHSVAPARIAFVHTPDAPDAERIVQMLSLTYTEKNKFSVISPTRVNNLVLQLGLNPFQQARDRERLATLLNVSTLIFVASFNDSDGASDYVQVYVSHYPENQPMGVEAFALQRGVLTAFQQIQSHLVIHLDNVSGGKTSDVLNAELAELVIQIQNAESHEQVERLQRDHQAQYQQSTAFWFALAQWANLAGLDDKADYYLSMLFETTAENTANYWVLRGRVLEAQLSGDLDSAALALDRLLEVYPSRPILLEQRAMIAQQLDDVSLAEQLLEAALSIDPNSGNLWFELGRLRINQGDIQSSIHHELAQGLIRFRQQEDLFGQGIILNALGVAYLRIGDLLASQNYFEQALKVRTANEDFMGQAVTLSNLANVLAIMQKYVEADLQLEKAAEIFATLNDHRGTAQVLNERGYLAEEQGKYDAALRYFRGALDLRIRYSSTEEQAETINNVAFVYFLSGDFSQADIFWRQANTLFDRIDHESGKLRTELQLANLHLHRGEYQMATRILAKVSNYIGDNRPIEQAFLNFVFSRRNFGLGNLDAALSNVVQAIEYASAIQDNRAIIENLLWKLEMCFWIADAGCFLREQEHLNSLQDGFTREQEIVFAWLNWSYNHATKTDNAVAEGKRLRESLNDINLPLHTEMKMRLLLWEFMPKAIDLEEKEALMAVVLPSYYQEHLHVNYLAARDGLQSSEALVRVLAQYPKHWRNHIFIQETPNSDTKVRLAKTEWLGSLEEEQAQRYSCWFYKECGSE
ncbi:serine/threonine protein kinase [Idiomarina sp. A28L]|uniref:serine/threonine-protein kinase n=1 Tax=Idiomarina sp. A28L TaxID=1036674 RepID=UPI00021389AA|nr:serine/threonine-protein kinase [Idiomarina sp. A28L]EGN74976.1 serine/threonine protein kinase [Idiomarina sp. A28L]